MLKSWNERCKQNIGFDTDPHEASVVPGSDKGHPPRHGEGQDDGKPL
ncbi:hypothetical protein [Sporolactobacillus sp. KGMB 08714]